MWSRWTTVNAAESTRGAGSDGSADAQAGAAATAAAAAAAASPLSTAEGLPPASYGRPGPGEFNLYTLGYEKLDDGEHPLDYPVRMRCGMCTAWPRAMA